MSEAIRAIESLIERAVELEDGSLLVVAEEIGRTQERRGLAGGAAGVRQWRALMEGLARARRQLGSYGLVQQVQ